jgi:hypothetical protein
MSQLSWLPFRIAFEGRDPQRRLGLELLVTLVKHSTIPEVTLIKRSASKEADR